MAKAYDDEINETLRSLARTIIQRDFDGIQNKLAEAVGLSPGFVSEFLSGKRGAGLDMLTGLGRISPHILLRVLGIDPRVLVVVRSEDLEEEGMRNLPPALRRASRAAMDLFGCTPQAALQAADAALAKHGNQPDWEPWFWLDKVKTEIERFRLSGERPSVRALIAKVDD